MTTAPPSAAPAAGSASGSAAPAPAPAPQVPSQLALRVLALATILGLAHALTIRLLGVDPLGLSVVGFASAIATFLFAYLRDRERAELKHRVRGVLFSVVDTSVLLALLLVVVVVGSSVSAVIVIADDGPAEVCLTAPGRVCDATAARALDDGDQTRYLRLTSPFGRPLRLEAAGSLAEPLVLYPWLPATFRLSRDLRALPAILVRVPIVKQLLLPGGRLVVSVRGVTSEYPTSAGKAALLLGRRAPIPPDVRANWELEATAEGLDSRLAAAAMLSWMQPLDGSALHQLTPGTPARVEFRSEADKVSASLLFTVRTDALQDYRLEPVD